MTEHNRTSPAIDSAIVPAAGFGTRLRPLTNAIPKEMLPLGRKPVLEHVLDELRAAGIRRCLFVISPGKEMIRDYFGDGAAFGVRCDYATQAAMRGLGDAVLQGEDWAGGRPIVVAFGDCIIESSGDSPLSRLLRTHAGTQSAATVLAQRILRESTRKYGILDPGALCEEAFTAPFQLAGIVEKPSPEEAPSTLAVAARWVLDPEIFKHIQSSTAGADGEVNLTDPVRAMMRSGRRAWGVPLLEGESRRDIGGWHTYLTAAAIAAIKDPEFGNHVREAALAEPGT